mmetsp:Transcript_7716/g.16087  ORF Transcript_7716/g.16087 Transcript_7716/m.16087 type:complete len:217 (-) Transcript_7716:98-748(-)
MIRNASMTGSSVKDTSACRQQQCDNIHRFCRRRFSLKIPPLLLAVAVSNILALADAFFHHTSPPHIAFRTSTRLSDYKDFREDDASCDGDSGEEIWGGDGDLDAPSEAIDDLAWRVAKLRLEEENTRRFLRAGPRFLPYEECRKWVAAWNRWDTEEDWKNWIREGEKRNAYIPARPDEYYGKIGKWISWDHFLGKEQTTNGPSDIGRHGDDSNQSQ